MMLSFPRAALAGCFLLSLVAPGCQSQTTTSTSTITNIISRDLRFSTLVTMLTAASLSGTLDSDGPFTLFAPTNDAFAVAMVNASRLLEETWSAHLTDLLTYHVALSEIYSIDLSLGETIPTAQGQEVITVTSSGSLLVLNQNSTVIEKDKKAKNGVVQVIDYVLLPISASQSIYQYAKAHSDYSILASLIEIAGLVNALNEPTARTIFAPTNSAFSPLQDYGWDSFTADAEKVRNLLLYHLLDGNVFSEELRTLESAQTVQGSEIKIDVVRLLDYDDTKEDSFQIILNEASNVAVVDTLVSNGIFHTIDHVLIPPELEEPTIAGLLATQGLTVFETAARRTGLWDVLNNPSQLHTCFAADNNGFDPEFSTILNDYDYYLHLEAAMNYQVAANQEYLTSELMPDMQLPTLLFDNNLLVTTGHPNRPIIINYESAISWPDLSASNGALQIMDRVMVPPFLMRNVVDVLARQPFVHSTFVYLLVLTGLIPELSTGEPFTIFAPTNTAFEQLMYQSGLLVGTDWTSNLDTMREILKYHIVPSVVYKEELTHLSEFETLQGDTILVTNTAYEPLVPLSTVVGADQRKKRSKSARRKLEIPGAPINGRRRRRLVSESHTVEGEVILDGRAGIFNSDQFGSNGVVHSIDTVLIPIWNEYAPSVASEGEAVDEFCVQWGEFPELCCPLEPDNTYVERQEDDYCKYVVIPVTTP